MNMSVRGIKRFEQSQRLDTAIYIKTYLYPFDQQKPTIFISEVLERHRYADGSAMVRQATTHVATVDGSDSILLCATGRSVDADTFTETTSVGHG